METSIRHATIVAALLLSFVATESLAVTIQSATATVTFGDIWIVEALLSEEAAWELDTIPAAIAADVGDGFVTGNGGSVQRALLSDDLFQAFGGVGFFLLYVDAANTAGEFDSLPVEVIVAPEPAAAALVLTAAACLASGHRGGRQTLHGSM